MKPKLIALVSLYFLSILLINSIHAQTFQEAKILSAKLKFVSAGGDLFENSNVKQPSKFTLNPAHSFFLSLDSFLDNQLNYSKIELWGTKNWSLAILPHIDLLDGRPTANLYPYTFTNSYIDNISTDIEWGEIYRYNYGFDFTEGVSSYPRKNTGLGITSPYRNINRKKYDSKQITGSPVVFDFGIIGLFNNK